jgi:hypothetical protein
MLLFHKARTGGSSGCTLDAPPIHWLHAYLASAANNDVADFIAIQIYSLDSAGKMLVVPG